MATTARYLEFFHLVFLGSLRPKPNQFAFVLKGGGNLRYFYHSVRYSQDIDLDIRTGSVETVQEAVDAVIRSRPLIATLATGGVAIRSCRPTKQTDTTQRWVITLDIRLEVSDASKQPAPTKIEFSSRPEMQDYAGEAAADYVPAEIVRLHAIRSPLIIHYLPAPAIIQKIRTLVERAKVQSRDIFDLELLFRTNPTVNVRGRVPDTYVSQAIDRVYEVPFEAYEEQVVAYLDDDYVEDYDARAAWERIQLDVITHLEALR